MRYVVFGAGGCGRDIHASMLRTLRQEASGSEAVYCDDALQGVDICGTSVIGRDDIRPSDRVIIAIAEGRIRERVSHEIEGASFIAATALISEHAQIGAGAVVSDFCIIGPLARIGRHFHCNYYSSVSHDVRIGDFVTFGPGVRCNGNVRIGDHVYVGSGAMIKQGVTIGEGATIGMGAVVVKDVRPNLTVVGNPARPVRSALRLAKAS